jgi:uncharacterized protein (DUF1778 family)
MKKKKQLKTGGVGPIYREHKLRVTQEQFREIEQAATKDARDREITYSRNNFCVRAVLAAARKLQDAN